MENIKKPILIVDDNPKNVQLLANILTNNGFDVEYALNGPDAIKLVASKIFHLILLDIMMPEMDGFEVCKRIKSDKKNDEIPVIFLTAKTDVESLEKAFESGGADYVYKPFIINELLARVNAHIELKTSKDKLKKVNKWLEEKVLIRTEALRNSNLQLKKEIQKHKQTSESLRQSENKYRELQSIALRSQMNPHFIFNTLNTMQSLMLLKGEREVNKYFGSFSKLIRFTLDMSSSKTILLKDEIDYLKSYVNIEKKRFNDELNYHFDIDPDLDLDNLKIPCMLFQPIIENAITHGLKPKKNNQKLQISIKKQGEFLKGSVLDNGIGREASLIKTKSRKNHISHAFNIINDRIDIFNSQNENKISFEIIDLKEEEKALGTEVCLTIPISSN